MKTAVYIDVLFAVNFAINCLLLSGTAKITKNRIYPSRIAAGAFAGAVYAVFMFFPQIKMLYSVMAKIAVSFIIVAITFTIRNFYAFFRTVMVFYITSFIFGAVSLCILYFTGAAKGSVISNGIFYFNLPWKVLIFSSFIAYIIIRVMWRVYKTDKVRAYKNLQISLFGKNVSLTALVDTGNMLKEPVTQTPVVVADFSSLEPIFPESFSTAYKQMNSSPESIILNCEGGEMIQRLRIIPFSSLGAADGILLGFRPDCVKIDRYITENIIIGISGTELSYSKDYDALINPEIFN